MTNKKSTKRALLVSAMAMVICFTMLLGTTFAWFTDSASSNGNIIKSGTLNIEMSWAEVNTSTWNTATEDVLTPMFTYQNYEPGYVDAKYIKLDNVGTLDFNYKLRLVAADNTALNGIVDVIDVYYYDSQVTLERGNVGSGTKLGSLREVLATGFTFGAGSLYDSADSGISTKTITIAFKMRETAGNEYQGIDLGSTFSVQVLAAQMESEFDSIDNDYDHDAEYDA